MSDDPTATVTGSPAGDSQPVPAADASVSEPTELRLRGIHHVTLISSNLDRTVAFYRDLLGMALLKQTINDDDPRARHFFFGDADASPGTMITFLEYPQMDQGEIGPGATHHFALRVGSIDELEAWREHLTAHGIQCTETIDRTYFNSIYFRDPDGQIVEIATDGPGLVID